MAGGILPGVFALCAGPEVRPPPPNGVRTKMMQIAESMQWWRHLKLASPCVLNAQDAPAWEAKLAEAWAARGRAEVAATAASKLLQSGGLPAGGADASKRPPSAPAGESAPAAGAEGNAAAEEADGAEDAGADEEGEGTPAEGAETKPATPAEDAKARLPISLSTAAAFAHR